MNYYGKEGSIWHVILMKNLPVVYVYFSVEEPSLVAMAMEDIDDCIGLLSGG